MEELKEPKYVQQIGEREERVRVYIEDYVNTFLTQWEDSREGLCFGLLIGVTGRHDGRPVRYISGAVKMDGARISGQAQLFPGSLQAAKKEKNRYFGNLEICGWYYLKKPWDNVDFASLEKLHLTHFGREGQLFCVLSQESGARFYYGAGERLSLLGGYFIYYEKNSKMQEYLVDHAAKRTEPKPEPAMERFRTVMKEKEEKKSRKALRFRAAAAAGLLAGAALLFIGGPLRLGEELSVEAALQTVQKQFSRISLPWKEEGEAWGEEGDSIVVQEIPGNIYPTKEPVTEAPTEPPAPETEASQSTQAPPEGSEQSQTGAASQPSEETAPEQTAAEAAKEPETYTVKKGDTLRGICRMLYGNEEKLQELIGLNEIENPNLLREGQVLKLP